jgi:uncharacterized protein YlxW (UPF0749 family)
MTDTSHAQRDKDPVPVKGDHQIRRKLFQQGAFFMAMLMCVFGFILISHIKSVKADKTTSSLAQRYKQRQAELKQAEEHYQVLLTENEKLNQQKADAIARLLSRQGYENLLSDLERIRIMAGFTEVRGPGIILTLDDKPGFDILTDSLNSIVHDGDVRHAFDLLRSSGAAAFAVNGLRITNASYISCIGTTILCNQQRMTPPYIIMALGNPTALAAAIREDPAFADRQTAEIGLQVKMEEKPEVIIPPFAEADNFIKYIDLLEVGKP